MLEHVQEGLRSLTDPALEPLFTRPSRLGPDSAWYGHLPFANWIMHATRPGLFVELGTHAGISYAGFCDAVLSGHLPTRCLAVDTWLGDEHAGFYGEQVYEDFRRFHDQRYGGFSRLLRCRFNQALDLVGDDSVDLLHIDGRHLFRDVTEDFNSWLPKLSRRGVVLLHDTNVRERDFGVWRFWDEQRGRYPSFEFLHAHGLGVLAVGPDAPSAVLELCRLVSARDAGLIRERFALAGERWEAEFALTQRDRQIAQLHAERDRQTDLHGQLQILTQDYAKLHDRLVQADQALRASTLELGLARSALADANAARHQAELGREVLSRVAAGEAAGARQFAAERDAARLALAMREQELAALQNSFFWRASLPLRRLLDRLRAGPAAAAAVAAAPLPLLEPPPPGTAHELESASPEPPPPEAAGPEPLSQAPRGTLRAIRRLLFVIGEPGTPGAAYRCQRNAAACRAAGFEADIVELFDVNPDNLAQADLLVLWRTTMSPHIDIMIRLARAAGTRVVFDVDDLMTRPELARIDVIDGIRTIGANEADTRIYFDAMLQTMMAADFCITTTEELATHMRLQRDIVHVLPNSFDENTLRHARYARRRRLESADDGRIRLGYAGGTRTHQKDFARAAPALARVLRARPRALLVLFREAANQRSLLHMDEFPELQELTAQIEWRDMVPLEALPGELARFDISLCPLEAGNPFCEAKSELKYFEAALAGVCTVASPTGPYRRAIRDGTTGLLAGDAAQWETAMLRLIDDPALRTGIARNAYHDALWHFGPWRQAQLAACLIAGLEPAPGTSGPGEGRAASARSIELGLRRGAYLARGLPEIPDSELLFAHDRLGEAEVTVVMTSYNYEHHILEALDSVRAQTLETLDLAIVDDGSSDQSVPLVIEWAKRHCDRFNRIRILRTVQNAGLGGARNVVFDAAETPFLMALDSDNRLRPDACASLLASLKAEPGAAFAYPRIRQFGSSDLLMGEPAFDPARLQTGNYIDAMAMVAKWAWAAAGGYYVRRDAMGWEDFDLWLNLVELGQFGVAVPEILAEYRVHANSMVNAITEQSSNKRAMVEFVEQRHPWLRLRTRDAKPRE